MECENVLIKGAEVHVQFRAIFAFATRISLVATLLLCVVDDRYVRRFPETQLFYPRAARVVDYNSRLIVLRAN